MNPADVAQSVLPLTSSDLSLFTLFWHAHWIVKAVMIGLLVCSVWVWAIAIDKTVLFNRTKRAMDRFEQAFWSGQSLEELYRSLSAKPAHSMAALFVAGYCQISFVATANNRIQTITPDRLRGRVMALYAQALIGVGPVGALQAGALAQRYGAPWAMAIGAVIAGAVMVGIRFLRPEVFSFPDQPASGAAASTKPGTTHRSAP